MNAAPDEAAHGKLSYKSDLNRCKDWKAVNRSVDKSDW
jgi:hypothetical protein